MVRVVDTSGLNRRGVGSGRHRCLRGSSSLRKLSKLLLGSGSTAGQKVPIATCIAGPNGNAPDVEHNKKQQTTDKVVEAELR